MDSQLGLELLTNRKKLKKKEDIINKNKLEVISQTYSPLKLDNIIQDLLINMSQLIKYRYQLKQDNDTLAREIVYDLLNDIIQDNDISVFIKENY